MECLIYRERLRALKAFSFNQKTESKEKLAENLVMQYALKAYIELLFKRVKYKQELTKSEVLFFDAYERVLDGKKLSKGDMVNIRDYINEKYHEEINRLKECDYTFILREMNNYKR